MWVPWHYSYYQAGHPLIWSLHILTFSSLSELCTAMIFSCFMNCAQSQGCFSITNKLFFSVCPNKSFSTFVSKKCLKKKDRKKERNACLSRVMTIVSYVFFSKFYNFTFYMKICKLKCAFVYCDNQKLICIFKWWFS